MTSHEEVKGEGFEMVDHEPSKRPEDEKAQTQKETQEGEEKVPSLDVYSVLRICVAQLSGIAWQMMGLQPDPFTNTMRKDIAQARVAIDATAALIEQLKPHLQGQEAKDYQNLLTDLQLNFVTHSKGQSESV